MQKKNERGITLIALVITIIILLIVTGLTIKIVVDEGILKKAEQTIDDANQKTAKENNLRENMEEEWNKKPEGIKSGTRNNSIDNNLNSNEQEKTPTTYTVIHEYYTNGAKDGNISNKISNAYVGDTVNTDSIGRISSYQNNTYTFTSADLNSLTLSENSSANIITLRYDRTSTNTPNPIDPVAPVTPTTP